MNTQENTDNNDKSVNNVKNDNIIHTENHDDDITNYDDDITNKEIIKDLFGLSGKFFMYLFVALFAFFGISLGIGFYRGFSGGDASYIDPNVFQLLFSVIT